MRTLIAAIAVSLIAGLALGTWMAGEGNSGADVDPSRETGGIASLQALEERLLSLEQVIAEEREARLNLEYRLQDLVIDRGSAAVERPTAAPEADDVADRRPPQRRSRDFVSMIRNYEERRLSNLTANGFSEDEARRVMRMESEAEFRAMRAAWEAQRNGEPIDPFSSAGNQQALLRAELGEADYERYLAAQGQPTSIQVTRVLDGSPGSDAGLLPGDRIVSYAGERVYNVSDLRSLTLQGSPGEDVVIEIERDGMRMQLGLQRGPVGISGAGARLRNMGWLGGS